LLLSKDITLGQTGRIRLKMIRISVELVRDYLNGTLQAHADEWYFNPPRFLTVPSGDDSTKGKILSCLEAILTQLDHFTPINRAAFDELFPMWENEELIVDLIVGFPSPYDAITEKAPDGKTHVVLDVYQLASYDLPPEQISSVINGLLTHEFAHVLIHSQFPTIEADENGSDYILAMNAITFDEGIAHLLSYKSKDLSDIDWNSQELKEVYERSKTALKSALAEKDHERQAALLEEANTGNFYDKFAAMSGMFYLAEQWNNDGIQGLKQELALGYRDLVLRILH